MEHFADNFIPVILMDRIIHTPDNPHCGDISCPCYGELENEPTQYNQCGLVSADNATRIILEKPFSMEEKRYAGLEDAQGALDRSESVRIVLAPFRIDPALVQLALDLQVKARLEEYQQQANQVDSHDYHP